MKKQGNRAAAAYGYNEISSGESSFEVSPPRRAPQRLSKVEREWQQRKNEQQSNPFNPFGIGVRHLNSSNESGAGDSSDYDYEQPSNSSSRMRALNNTAETGNTPLSKYDYSQAEGLDQSILSTGTASTQKRSGKSFSSTSFSFSRSMKSASKQNSKSNSNSHSNSHSNSLNMTNTSLNTTKSGGGRTVRVVTPGSNSRSKDTSRSMSRSMQSSSLGSSLQSSLMPSMNLMSSSDEDSDTDADTSSRRRNHHHHHNNSTSSYPSPSKPRFLEELPKAKEEEPPPKYYHPAYWNARLSRREVYSRHYRPNRKEQDELDELEQFLGIPDARKNKKNVILYQWSQLNPSEHDAKKDGMPRSIVLKRGPVAWSKHEDCELILLTRGFVVARKVFQYIPRFQTSDLWTNVQKITPTGLTSFAIYCGAGKTLEFTCPTSSEKDAWMQALKIVVLQAHTHSSFNPKSEREYDMGWQYRLIHTPWFTEATTGAIRLDSYELDRMDNRTINQLDTYNSYAPLHYAVRANHVDAMRFLLQAGADPNVVDGFGRTPMFYADLDQLPTSSVELLELYGAKGPNSGKGCFAAPEPKTQTTSRCRRCSIIILALLLIATGVTTFLVWYLTGDNNNGSGDATSLTSGQAQSNTSNGSEVGDEEGNSNDIRESTPTSTTPPPLVVTGVNPYPATNITTISPAPSTAPTSAPPTVHPISTAPTTMPSLSVGKDVDSPESNNPTTGITTVNPEAEQTDDFYQETVQGNNPNATEPTVGPSQADASIPTSSPTEATASPVTELPSAVPTNAVTTFSPTIAVTQAATTRSPTWTPTTLPSAIPTGVPSVTPSTIAPTIAETTAPTFAPTAATLPPTFLFETGPTTFPTFETIFPEFVLPEDINLFNFLVENSLDAGASLRNPQSPQYNAFRWLSGNSGLTTFSDERKIQRYALATFYYSTFGNEWSNNDFWLSDEDECTMWFSRIAEFGPADTICNGENQITTIDLDYNNLKGKLPGEIGLLTKLRRLELYGGPQNFLTGSFPTELAFLTELESLSVRGNQMTGAIPDMLGSLQALRTLNLSQNRFTSQIPSELGLLLQLTDLALETNRLSGALPSELGEITGLQSLSVGTNKISGQIPSQLGQLSELQGFEGELNEFSSTLPSELGLLSKLTTFQVTINEIEGSIPSEFGGLQALQSLLLRGNSLTGSIPSEIGLMLNLQASVDLSFNELSGSIPSEFGRLSLLRGLYLNSNLLSSEIPSELAQLSRLNTLRLESNNLSGAVPIDACDVFLNTFPMFYLDCLEVTCSCCTYCCVDDAGCSCEHAGTANEFLC